MLRFFDRISRPKPPQKRPRRRRARLRFVMVVRAAALVVLAAGAVFGVAALAATLLAPETVRRLDSPLRTFYWRDVYAYAGQLQGALHSGDQAAAITAGRRLFAAGKGVRFNEAPMATIIHVADLAFASGISQLRGEAARYVTNLSPNDSYAWHVLGEESRREGRLDDAEKAFLRALELRPYSYPTAAALIALYEKSGYPDRAKATHQRLREGVNMLLGVGTPLEAIFGDGKNIWGRSPVWFNGCRPNRLEVSVPSDTRTGFLLLPPANGAEVSLTALTALTDDGRATQPWTTFFGNQFFPVANGYRIALGRDAPFTAQAVIRLEASGDGVSAKMLRFDFSMCLPDFVDPMTQPVTADPVTQPVIGRPLAQSVAGVLVWQGHGQGRNRPLASRACHETDQRFVVEFPVTDIYVVLPVDEVVVTVSNGIITPPGGGASLSIKPSTVSHAHQLGAGLFKSRPKADAPVGEPAVIGLYSGAALPAGTSIQMRASICSSSEYGRR